MAGRGLVTYDIVKGNKTIKVSYFYDEIIIYLLMKAGSEGKTVTSIRTETGLAEMTIRKILNQYTAMNRVKKKEGRSSRNIKQFVYVLINQVVDLA